MKIYKKKKTYNRKIVKFFGIKLYETYKKNEKYYKKILYGLYKLTIDKYYKKYYLLGIKIYKKAIILPSNDVIEIITNNLNRYLIASNLHQKTFLPYKNKHYMQEVVLVGAGPSLHNYIPLKNVYHLGLNRVFEYSKIHFDYLFATNKTGLEDYKAGFINYSNCDKFIGDEYGSKYFQIPESFLIKANAKRYINTSGLTNKKFAFFLETEPLYASSTVSIQAMQFLLYTNPKRIYLVGIDCSVSSNGHFIGQTSEIAKNKEDLVNNDFKAIEDWKNIKAFAQIYYPETEIISINPIGLKGLFREIYTSDDRYYVDEANNIVNCNI